MSEKITMSVDCFTGMQRKILRQREANNRLEDAYLGLRSKYLMIARENNNLREENNKCMRVINPEVFEKIDMHYMKKLAKRR